MIKTLLAADRSEREHFRIPRSVQQSIPVQKIYRDGIWQVGGGKYSRTWRFADINYALASHEDQRDMFSAYCGVLNSLPTDATTKITINNRRLNGADFQRSILMRERGNDLDRYRREYNRVVTDKASESNDLIQDKYITVSVARKSIEESRTFFHRVDTDLGKNFGRLESGARPLDNQERLRIFHDFFRPGEEEQFHFDLSDAMRKGHDFRDYSAQFLYKCWKRFRKYAAAMTAATQNIEECLRSETARLMLANSEFLILLNQAATDRAELAKLLHISETQMSHVTNVEAGHGLMRIGSSIIPFINEFPRDSELYRLMSTTPGDK